MAAAANLTSLAVGTETDGSITAPAAEAAVVGMKPTLGLVSQKGIIPIAASQDTAGPMARTVTDAALLLNVLRSPFGEVRRHRLPHDYTACLNPKALKGARLAYDHRYVEGDFGPLDDELLAVVDAALDEMRKAGAVIDDVTTADPTAPTADGRVPFDDEFTVLLFEFKVQIAQYLARLEHTKMRTLADLIAFNLAHCEEEMRYFGQEVFELAEATSGDLTDPEYLAAWRTNRGFGRTVIDSLLAQGYQAVITPSFSFGTSNPAVAGYPSISVPVGFTAASRPVGIWLAAGFLQEPTLLGLAYATEQLLHGRRPPELLGSPPVYPDAGICAAPAFNGDVARAVAAMRARAARVEPASRYGRRGEPPHEPLPTSIRRAQQDLPYPRRRRSDSRGEHGQLEARHVEDLAADAPPLRRRDRHGPGRGRHSFRNWRVRPPTTRVPAGSTGSCSKATVLELQEAMARSRVSSAEITQFYLARIRLAEPRRWVPSSRRIPTPSRSPNVSTESGARGACAGRCTASR